jgi:formamidopyrimidine-DNA glycosylase
VPAPDAAYGEKLVGVGRRGKHLLVEFKPVTFVVHLMQGGRLLPDTKMSHKPRNGQARFLFDGEVPALLLTEAGTERRAGVWCVPSSEVMTSPPITSDRRRVRSNRTSWQRGSRCVRRGCTASCATSR